MIPLTFYIKLYSDVNIFAITIHTYDMYNHDYVYTAPLIKFNNIRSFTADQLQLLHSSEE